MRPYEIKDDGGKTLGAGDSHGVMLDQAFRIMEGDPTLAHVAVIRTADGESVGGVWRRRDNGRLIRSKAVG
jgi:hypothetical protein